ncbi:MAG: hypothetical protein IKG80_03320 [Clostridia bacterium]|nr:hypothetical protein [Clostridia bacterium]
MFGYVKPDISELKVKEYDAYRAVYCGVCKSAGKWLGHPARLALSYDAVFLAASRMLASGSALSIGSGRCAAHPFKKRPVCADCDETRYASYVTAILTYSKITDDLHDERGLKKLRARLVSPFARGSAKRALKRGGPAAAEAARAVGNSLARLSELEAARSPSLDETAECFGELLGAVFAAGFEGAKRRILYEVGRSTGRFIYAADAADDAVRDGISGNYNPIVLSYGEGAFEGEGKERRLTLRTADAILRGAMLDLGRLPPAVELLCEGGDPTVSAIVKNIAFSGMPKTMNLIISKNAGADAVGSHDKEDDAGE